MARLRTVWLLLGASALTPSVTAQSRETQRMLRELHTRVRDAGYRTVLRQFRVDADGERFGALFEAGPRRVASYAGHRELPAGYWVYVRPYWFILAECAPFATDLRGCGTEQARGEPNTPGTGDQPTAWAPRAEDAGNEWLLVEYSAPVDATRIEVHETFRPGAVERVTAFTLDGVEHEVWRSSAPAQPIAEPRRVLSIRPDRAPLTNRIKLYLATDRVPGFNEIDAVAVVDPLGRRHWADGAAASSTYPGELPLPAPLAVGAPRPPLELAVAKLDRRVAAVDARLRALERKLDRILALLERRGK